MWQPWRHVTYRFFSPAVPLLSGFTGGTCAPLPYLVFLPSNAPQVLPMSFQYSGLQSNQRTKRASAKKNILGEVRDFQMGTVSHFFTSAIPLIFSSETKGKCFKKIKINGLM
ncbi:hypothetical protein TNIN_130051 [Trichonephila inaurata madagascariensis]|uniref:Uncharacterized protein n=1 Tax=Trichonephila inaurata madagascariensis TaxID=2747483 RepID=A0A8X6XEU0_9ARAC|nr:hypothetical protein TNIN_130051 [Trichonephila inaurata madagascariensis]